MECEMVHMASHGFVVLYLSDVVFDFSAMVEIEFFSSKRSLCQKNKARK